MITSATPLIAWTDKGLYCAAGDFYIDPLKGVPTALITHAHSDHARRGSGRYICEKSGLGLLKVRLGQKIQAEGIPYRQTFQLGTVQVSFHSAGHILGSAQLRIHDIARDAVWVVSGDYKRELDPSCEPFEIVKCDTFVTEATFGTPKYIWEKGSQHGRDIHSWWIQNRSQGKNSLLFGYSLGKAQRILAELAPWMDRPVYIDASMVALTECYRQQGRLLAPTRSLEEVSSQEVLCGELILAPPSILKSKLADRLGEFKTAFASGWMKGSSFNRGYGESYDHGFVISDHADWNDINQTIDETGAKNVFVLHRGQGALIRHLRKKGISAYPVSELRPAHYQCQVEQNLSLFQEN